MSRLRKRSFVVVSSGDNEGELIKMCLHYREHKKHGEEFDLVDLRIEQDAPIRSVYCYHLVRLLS